MDTFDCAIIGAGPAGMTAALQLKQQEISFVIFEKYKAGGQLLAANRVENFPGILKGIAGKTLVKKITNQLELHGIKITKGAVTALCKKGDIFHLQAGAKTFFAKSVITACGLVPKRLSIPGEEELFGKKIFSYIPVETVPHNGKKILVIGGGDAAFDQALSFSKRAADVKITMNKEAAVCNPSLFRDVRKTGIGIFKNHTAVSFCKSGNKIKTSFQNGKIITADFAVTCIGKERDFGFIAPELLEGNVQGLYFAGDCKRGKTTYTLIACGDGSSVAIELCQHRRGKIR